MPFIVYLWLLSNPPYYCAILYHITLQLRIIQKKKKNYENLTKFSLALNPSNPSLSKQQGHTLICCCTATWSSWPGTSSSSWTTSLRSCARVASTREEYIHGCRNLQSSLEGEIKRAIKIYLKIHMYLSIHLLLYCIWSYRKLGLNARWTILGLWQARQGEARHDLHDPGVQGRHVAVFCPAWRACHCARQEPRQKVQACWPRNMCNVCQAWWAFYCRLSTWSCWPTIRKISLSLPDNSVHFHSLFFSPAILVCPIFSLLPLPLLFATLLSLFGPHALVHSLSPSLRLGRSLSHAVSLPISRLLAFTRTHSLCSLNRALAFSAQLSLTPLLTLSHSIRPSFTYCLSFDSLILFLAICIFLLPLCSISRSFLSPLLSSLFCYTLLLYPFLSFFLVPSVDLSPTPRFCLFFYLVCIGPNDKTIPLTVNQAVFLATVDMAKELNKMTDAPKKSVALVRPLPPNAPGAERRHRRLTAISGSFSAGADWHQNGMIPGIVSNAISISHILEFYKQELT